MMTSHGEDIAVRVERLAYEHIGRRVAAEPPDTKGLRVAGLIRWYVVTSDQVVVAIEESEDDGAFEWAFAIGSELTLTGGAS